MKSKLAKIAKDTNLYLKRFIDKQNNSKLIPSMKYGLFPGGKKIRSKILIDIGSLLSIDHKTLITIGSAVECIHAYSLIHYSLFLKIQFQTPLLMEYYRLLRLFYPRLISRIKEG